MSHLDVFFNPKTIAIIGASERFKFGYGTTKYLLNSEFKTYPIHLAKNEILGYKAYKSVKDVPEDVDLAIIIVNNDQVLQAVKECVEKRVKGIIVESAGFAETGIEKYIKIQQEIEVIAKSSGVRIVGPNCVGVTNFKNKFTTTEVDFQRTIDEGSISVIAQSGVLGNIFVDWCSSQRIGLNKTITLGNKVDVDEIDMLEYLQNDPETNVITLYLEGVKRGQKFLDVLKKMTKPVLILKNGKSDYGTTAIKSHTGSLAGNDKVYDAIIKQFPTIFRVNNFYEMFNIAQAFAAQILPKGKNLAIITGSGSLGILACDEIEKQGLKLAKFNESTINELKDIAPNWVSVKNPVDLGPSQFQTFVPSLKAVMNDRNVDALFFIFTVPELPLRTFSFSITPHIRLIKKLSTDLQKPCIICVFGSRWVFEHILEKAVNCNIPVMAQISHAIKAFKMMYEFAQSSNVKKL